MQVLNGFCSYFPQKLLGNRFQEVGILDDKLTYVKKSTKCCSVVVEEISVTLKGWLIRYRSIANGLPTLICEAIAVVNQVVELVYRAFVILEGNTTVTIISKSHTGLKTVTFRPIHVMEITPEYSEISTVTFEWTLRGLKNLFDTTKGDKKSKVTKSIRFGNDKWQVCA